MVICSVHLSPTNVFIYEWVFLSATVLFFAIILTKAISMDSKYDQFAYLESIYAI